MVSNYWEASLPSIFCFAARREKMVRGSNLKIETSHGFPDSRGQTILTAIINEHFITGEPVGSKTIAEKFANASGLSSASSERDG